MENVILKAKITATSKKVDGKFKNQSERPTKTAYVEIDPADRQKALDFGLSEYTSKKDGNNFFIVKLPANVAIYVQGGGDAPEMMDGSIETDNFKTTDDRFLPMNFLKGENMGNTFYRLQAIQISSSQDIETIKPENPFA